MRMLLDIVRQSLSTLWAHKLRSFLTMFGIAWGVGSLLLLVGLGEGFRSGQEKQLATLGQNIMFMFPGRIPAVAGSTQSGQTYYFTYDDYLAIREQAQFVGRAFAGAQSRRHSRGQRLRIDQRPGLRRSFRLQPDSQRPDRARAAGSTMKTTQQRRRVAIVGWELLKNMFPGRPAVGSTILLNGIRFDIIGVVAKVGQDGNNGTNSRIFIPIRDHAQSVSAEGAELREMRSRSSTTARPRKSCTPGSEEEVHEIIARPPWFRSQA